MPANSQLDVYRDACDDWRMIRHCLAGERIIKQGGWLGDLSISPEVYLPRPSGMKRDQQGNEQYNAYKARAEFPDFVSTALRGYLGILFRKPSRLELPPRLEYLRDSAIPEGLSFDGLERRVASDQLAFGRHILLPELPRNGGLARIISYPPETLINWRYSLVDGQKKLTLAVLEITSDQESDDWFVTEQVKEWLVLRLEDGIYRQSIYRADGDSGMPLLQEEDITPTIRGEPLDEIPLTILGSVDLDAAIDEKPILGLCRTALEIYQISADYRHALFMVSQPTPYITGASPNEEGYPQSIGSGTIWFLPDPQSSVGFLEYTGAGVNSQREALMDRFERAAQQGAQMLESNKRAAESGEALRLRQAAKNATLQTISDVLAEGLNRALSFVARWNDIDPESVVYEPNDDFVDNPMSAQELQATVDSWIKGGIGAEVLYHRLHEAEMLPDEMTFDEFQRDRAA